MKTLLLLLAFGISLRAEEAPAPKEPDKALYAVLKVVRGEETAFQVVPSKQAKEEKKRILEEAKTQRADWKAQRSAFLKDRANEGKKFEVPEPFTPIVTLAKNHLKTEEAARRWADGAQRKSDDELRAEKAKKAKKGDSGGGKPADWDPGTEGAVLGGTPPPE